MGIPIKLSDGTIVLAEVKQGVEITDEDKRILAEWIEFVRDESDKRKAAEVERAIARMAR